MRLPFAPRSVVTASALALLALSCGKSSSDSNDDKGNEKKPNTPTGKVDPETAKVTDPAEKLTLASSLVLLPAKDPATAKLLVTSEAAPVAGRLRSSSDASARKLSLRVEEDSFEALKEVGNIMCHFSQTRFWEQANKGKYKALIDGKKCEEGKGGGDEEEDRAPRTVEAFVEATRKKDEPLKARVKFEMREGGQYTTYQALIVVAAPPSDENPAGLFSMHFNGYADEALTKPLGGGFIRTRKESDKKFLLEFWSDEADEREGRKFRSRGGAAAVLDKSGDDFTGVMTSLADREFSDRDGRTYQEAPRYAVRFDRNALRVTGKKAEWSENGPVMRDVNACFDRNKFKTLIWQYDLTDTAGNLVELAGNIQIEADLEGRKVTGNAGYGGVWLPGSPSLENGQRVRKVEWEKGKKKTTDLTVVTGPGKLLKFERKTVTLGELKGTDFNMWEQGQDGAPGGQVIVQWDGTTLRKVATVAQGQGNTPPEVQPLSAPVALDPNTFNDWGLRLRSDALGAELNFPKGATLSDAYTIGYHAETVVTKSVDVPTGKLLCFGACPKISMKTSELQMPGMGGEMGQNGCPPLWSRANKTTQVTFPGPMARTCEIDGRQNIADKTTALAEYTWDQAARAIKEGDTAFTLTADDSGGSTGGGNSGGNGGGGFYSSGALIPESVYDGLAAASKEKWPDAAAQELEVFYRWQTGTGAWSRFVGIADASGTLLSFDRPLDFAYKHTAANDFDGDAENPAIGKIARLSYAGPGQLWGFPFKMLPEIGRQGALYSLRAGTKLTEGGKEYAAFPVRGEQRLAKATDATCAKLKLDGMPKLPKPENRNVKHPDLTGDLELRYVNGELP